MAGARPPGSVPVGMYNDDEEENSADSVEQAALEASRRDESLLDPDSLMFEELDDERQQPLGEEDHDDDDEEEEEQATVGRRGRGLDDNPVTSPDALFDETDSILNTPYGSPMSDISSIANNQKWIGEVKQMLLEDQRKSQSRTKAWATSQAETVGSMSPSIGGIDIEPLVGDQWKEGLDPEMGLDNMPSPEELAEKYSSELVEKDLLILEKDKRISTLEKTQRSLESTLEDCQKELRVKSEAATTGVEKLKRTLEEKDKCIMETSERLRKVTESYNSSEKRWKDQQEFLEKQIQKLKSELEDKSSLDEEIQKLTEASRHEKETLEQQLEEAKEANKNLQQNFSHEKKKLEDELEQLREEKAALESELREEIEVLQTKLILSEDAVETALREKETIKIELESLETKNRALTLEVGALQGKEEMISQNEFQKAELENMITALRQQLEEKEQSLLQAQQEFESERETLLKTLSENKEQFAETERAYQEEKDSLLKEMETRQEQFAVRQHELQVEKESMLQEIEEAKERVEVEVEEAPVNFFTQSTLSAAPADPWAETKKSLEDRIAELELEKGNLLLQLVDVDEHEQQEAQKNATAAAEENARQLQTMQAAMEEIQRRNEFLEKELEESKSREIQRIETAMNTIDWEEKYEVLQKENQTLQEELSSQRKAADDLSGRYEELESKFAALELEKPPISGVAEIDKCDGWSDGDTPQLPDEGFTEMEAQISELKASIDTKQQQIEEMLRSQKDAEDKLVERNLMLSQYEAKIEQLTAENASCQDKLQEYAQELERLNQELIEKITQQETVVPVVATVQATASSDGWADDAPVLLDEGFNEDNQVAELKQELTKKNEELTAVTNKYKTTEDKLKKALKVLKQKNDKLAELKHRLGDDAMVTSVSPMESSVVVEPMVTKSTAYVCGETQELQRANASLQNEVEQWKHGCEEKEVKIKQLEHNLVMMQDRLVSSSYPDSGAQDLVDIVAQRDMEIVNLRSELTKLASSLDSKDEEVEKLMNTCSEMQKSIDEKVELINDCVAKKDAEVRQAISQYEDFLKDATLNVSHLTKELEEKIREINNLNGQVLDAQQQALEIQNEFDAYREEKDDLEERLEDKAIEVKKLKKEDKHLREEINRLQSQLNESLSSHTVLSEALDRAEAEKKQLREECVCIQNEYGNKSRELQVQVSQLIDQLNERESAISVLEARLKESDEVSDKTANEIKMQLDEKTKALDQFEQSLFVKTEECVRLEERLREAEENFRRELNAKLTELEDQHKRAFQEYASQTSFDLEQTCEQLAKKNDEVVKLQQQCSQLQEQLLQDYNSKCSEMAQVEQLKQENAELKQTVQVQEYTITTMTNAASQNSDDLERKDEEIKNLKTILTQYEEKSYNEAMEKDGLQRQLHETQNSLVQTNHNLGAYYNELTNSQGECERLRKSLEECQTTIEKLSTDASEAKTEAARRATEVQNLTNQLAKYQEIESNLNKYLEDLNSATEELGKRNSEYRELEKASKAQEMQLQTLNANVESGKSELAELYKKLAEKDDRIMSAEAELVELRNAAQKDQGAAGNIQELLEEVEEKNREISDLRFELEEGIIQEKRLKENLESRENEIRQLRNLLEEKEREIEDAWQSFKFTQSSTPIPKEEGSGDAAADASLLDKLEQSEKEKENLERKIDLLMNKLEEVEASEVKCYEDFSRLKILRTELEMDNLRMSAELEQLRRSLQAGDNDPKYKAMENQLILMTKTLDDRDKLCRDLMKNISQLQENCDALRIRVNNMTLPQPFALSPDSLEAKFVDQDRELFSLKVDLEREKKIRELYEGQLFLAASKKQFENSTKKNTSSGSWFGLGELFSSPAPPPRLSPTPSTRSSVSASLAPPTSQYFDPHSSSALARPVTPVTPATAFSSSIFETPGQAGPGPQYFVPQTVTPGPSSAEGTQPAQSTSNVVDPAYANFLTQP